ncbi:MULTISPECIES: hypothetical protein [unclassified Prochlorococcus]|uniref:hypothetical protein n=2 Tax=Prochlorococcus TaxID=1218 RepID=UPI000567B941
MPLQTSSNLQLKQADHQHAAMKTPWPDRLVMLALAATLLIVFCLIFSLRPAGQQGKEPALQWRETPEATSGALQI